MRRNPFLNKRGVRGGERIKRPGLWNDGARLLYLRGGLRDET